MKRIWVRDVFKIVISLLVMASLILLLNPADEWWQDSSLWQKVGKLLLLVATAIVSYFGTLFVLGIRKQSFTI